MKAVFLYLLIASNTINLFSQSDLMSKGDEVFLETSGDLDKDNIDEKAIVYKLKNPVLKIDSISKDSTVYEYELILYKYVKSTWKIWQRYTNSIVSDYIQDQPPYPEFSVNIKNGILIIINGEGTGGSNTMYQNTYKFRYQKNNFELIGYTYRTGQFCRGEMSIDYNVFIGKVIIEDKVSNCFYDSITGQMIEKFESKKEIFNHKLNEKITLSNIFNKEINFTSPKLRIKVSIEK